MTTFVEPDPSVAEPPPSVLPAAARRGHPRRRWLLVLTPLLAMVLGGGWALAGWSAAAPTGSASVVPPPAPRLELGGEQNGALPWNHPLTVLVLGGVITGVAATDPDGAPVSGRVTDPHHWVGVGSLIPAATYRLTVRFTDLTGRQHVQPVIAHTQPADRIVHAVISPGDGDTVGVGEPVALYLDQPVTSAADRALLVARLKVVSTPAVAGAWRWLTSSELHYRAPDYWAAGSTVRVQSDFTRLHLSNGIWGSGHRSVTFHTGDALVSTVDVTAHTMTVRRNGVVLRVMKASVGRPDYPTYGGVHVVLEKLPVTVMDSTTTGHPKGTPGYYHETVYWDVRISDGGAFVHSAPWSVADQGVRNVSHGCVNLAPADAIWFYNLSRRGDVVDIIHAAVGPRLWDPGMADWNIPFSQWAA